MQKQFILKFVHNFKELVFYVLHFWIQGSAHIFSCIFLPTFWSSLLHVSDSIFVSINLSNSSKPGVIILSVTLLILTIYHLGAHSGINGHVLSAWIKGTDVYQGIWKSLWKIVKRLAHFWIPQIFKFHKLFEDHLCNWCIFSFFFLYSFAKSTFGHPHLEHIFLSVSCVHFTAMLHILLLIKYDLFFLVMTTDCYYRDWGQWSHRS